jgi:hypothetical protein
VPRQRGRDGMPAMERRPACRWVPLPTMEGPVECLAIEVSPCAGVRAVARLSTWLEGLGAASEWS